MEEALLAHIAAAAAVSALVGARIYYADRPQTSPVPDLVLEVVDSAEGVTLDGGDGLTVSLVRAHCWGRTAAEAIAIGRAVRALLHGRSFVAGGVDFQTIAVADRGQTFEGEEPERLYRNLLELNLWHSLA